MNRKTENYLLACYARRFSKNIYFLTLWDSPNGKCTDLAKVLSLCIINLKNVERYGTKPFFFYFLEQMDFAEKLTLCQQKSLGGKHLSMKMEKTLKGPNLIFHAVRSKKSDIGRNIMYSLCCQNGSSRIPIANFAD